MRAALSLAALALALPALAGPIGDSRRGEAVYRKECAACHAVGPEARTRVGPVLNRLYGRRAGSVADFAYSKSMARMGADGLAWTYATLDAYVANPKALVSGTRMAYRGLADPVARHDLLAYLRDWSDRPSDIPEAEPTALPSTAARMPEGDPELGAWLSSECTTCHQKDGTDRGIPSITGWPQEDFFAAMDAYRTKLRPHPVMQMMAGRLSDEEIAALAAHFAAVE